MRIILTILFWVGLALICFALFLESLYTKGLVAPEPTPPGVFRESWEIALAPFAYFFVLFIAWMGASFVIAEVMNGTRQRAPLKLGLIGGALLVISLINMILVSPMLFQVLFVLVHPIIGTTIGLLTILIFLSPGITLAVLAWTTSRKKSTPSLSASL